MRSVKRRGAGSNARLTLVEIPSDDPWLERLADAVVEMMTRGWSDSHIDELIRELKKAIRS